MKKIVKIFSLVFVVVTSVFIIKNYFSNGKQNPSSSPPPALGIDVDNEKLSKIKLNNREYAYFLITVENANLLKLISNFQEKLTSKEVQEKYFCKALTSGGFYLRDNSPAGLFVSEGNILKKWTANKFFNGVLSVNDFAIPRITWEVPRDKLRIGLQTGPVLIENAQEIQLPVSDEYARRVIAAVTGDNILYFLVVYNPDQVFGGPRLQDLYFILSQIEKKTGIFFC